PEVKPAECPLHKKKGESCQYFWLLFPFFGVYTTVTVLQCSTVTVFFSFALAKDLEERLDVAVKQVHVWQRLLAEDWAALGELILVGRLLDLVVDADRNLLAAFVRL